MTSSFLVSKIPLPMLELIPSGYYAVRPDTDTPFAFVRLVNPVNVGKMKGWVKVQTQHGENFEDRWYWNPSNPDPRTHVRTIHSWKFVWHGQSVEDLMLLMIVDHRRAARDYAREIGNCHRCNKDLTDERSRHYGFGPECEKVLEGEKDEIDDENGGTFEELKARGKI